MGVGGVEHYRVVLVEHEGREQWVVSDEDEIQVGLKFERREEATRATCIFILWICSVEKKRSRA
jgi:hypothetical protein